MRALPLAFARMYILFMEVYYYEKSIPNYFNSR